MTKNSQPFSLFLLLSLVSLSFAQQESDYYRIVTMPIPSGVVLEAGGMEFLPDGRLAVSSRRGDIYMVQNPLAKDPKKMVFKRFAHGLHEVLGLAYRNGWLYATQRCELTRIKDLDKDGRGDLFQTVSDGWEIGGDYHEYAFGSKFDRDGNIWVVLCLTGSFNSNFPFRGWCLRIDKNGKAIPTCSGIRSPGGIGMNAAGDVFYTDNQGPWNGTCGLKHLAPGTFQGHPGGNRWYSLAKNLGKTPKNPVSGSRMMAEAGKIPELYPTSVLFPYKKMGQSASGIVCDRTAGKFGPFKNQLFVGDQTFSTVMRVYLEKVNGRYQGACFPFKAGFASGTLSLQMAPNGSMFVGGTNRGWGSRGRQPFALQRLDWTGKVPFEVHEMHARPDGFEFTFTQPVDEKTVTDVKSYQVQTYTYIYRAQYGSPEVDHTRPKIQKIVMGEDKKSVRVYLDKLQIGHVHEFHLNGVRSEKKLPLLHAQAYYTLNYVPKK